ncbi:hypothetical protein [Streptomyces sp. NPDC048392]|uniref:hypothetical protein n=1 Tax=Streptomyces sp. NPDC048392 TaxID=3365543 RepID=UPI00371F05A5
MSTPPKPGKALSVKVDPQLYDDLATLMRTGMTLSDAVRQAAAIVASAYRNAWEDGRIPDGMSPQITHVMVRPYDGLRATGPTAGAPVTPAGGEPR